MTRAAEKGLTTDEYPPVRDHALNVIGAGLQRSDAPREPAGI
jgi:hypothetical protein